MDVQAAAATGLSPPALAPITSPSVPVPTAWPAAAAASAGAASVPVVSGIYPPVAAAGSSTAAGSTPADATPSLPPPPSGHPAGSTPSGASEGTLSGGVAKLYNAQEQNVSVSFQIEHNPNEIVTVFTDKQTGKVIVQFPSETLIALAQFFDKLDGSVVNEQV